MKPSPTKLLAFLLAACAASNPDVPPPAPAESAVAAQVTETSAVEGRQPGTPRPWEHETSDVPVDPRVHFGELDNGLRFAWAHNGEPKDRVYLRMHVDAGSLAETDDERGMAHFLEHLAFNGSEHFEAGTLIEWFQEHGMSFGADTNAHTGFSETVYKLDLPDRDQETVREGLVVLRDFAGGLLLAGEEVQQEKGVIDSEERERDSADYRVFTRTVKNLYRGTRFAERIPIGTKESRDTFDATRVRAFYERWYRPENITLVLVGDVRDWDPTGLISEVFGNLEGPGTPVAPEPDRGSPPAAERFFFVHEPERSHASITIARLKPFVDRPDTIERRREELAVGVARAILNLRFDEATRREGCPFLGAGVGEAGGFEIFEGGELGVFSSPESWREATTAAILELRGALEFGFQEAELREVRAEIARALDEAVEREATAPSARLREELLLVAELGGVPTDAATDREILLPALEALTVEDCARALRTEWRGGELCAYAIGPLDIADPRSELGGLHAAAYDVEIEAPERISETPFAYASDPARAGEIVRREAVEDLGLVRVELDNGVRLTCKPTDFAERQIVLRARLGAGELALDDADLPISEIGAQAFGGGGLEAHDVDDLRRILAGKQVSVGMSVHPDHFRFAGATTAEDLLLELELLCAWIEHPGYRDDQLAVIRQELPLVFERYRHTPAGPTAFEFLPVALAGDPRATLLGLDRTSPLDDLLRVDMERIRAAFAPSLERAPIELTIVGDFDVEETIRLAARTVGALPRRDPIPDDVPAAGGARVVSDVHVTSRIETRDPRAMLLMLFPAGDGLETARRRHVQFLGVIVDDRLRLVVREALGAAYSPFAAAEASTVFPGLGALMIQAAGEPAQMDRLVEACETVAADLVENGVTEEEVARLSEPLLNQLRDARRNNAYWLEVLDESHGRPETLDEVRSVVGFYETLDAKALSRVAAEVLDPEKASTLVVLPGAGEEGR